MLVDERMTSVGSNHQRHPGVGPELLELLPNLSLLSKEINALLRAVSPLRTPGLQSSDYALIGTAIDYRIRYYLQVDSPSKLLATLGIRSFVRRVTSMRPDLAATARTFSDGLFDGLDHWLAW